MASSSSTAPPPPTDFNLNSISQEYTYEDLVAASDGFSASSLMGRGTYGSVYRGLLRDGTEVAIKALSRPNEAGFREEVEVLSRFRHPNLVILMGFARRGSERYLVYELLPGGDLCARLQSSAPFTWRRRASVALDAALGLSHLHGSRPQVFHRDVKSQNILMDRNGSGKMADFGLALLAQPDCDSATVERTAGTIGYADPAYIRSGKVTERTEVYSFGMVLLELLTRRPPAVQRASGRIEYQFLHLAGDLSRVLAMVDRRVDWPKGTAECLGDLALDCIQEEEESRPTFVELVTHLRRLLREHAADDDEGAAASALPASAASGRSWSHERPEERQRGQLNASGLRPSVAAREAAERVLLRNEMQRGEALRIESSQYAEAAGDFAKKPSLLLTPAVSREVSGQMPASATSASAAPGAHAGRLLPSALLMPAAAGKDVAPASGSSGGYVGSGGMLGSSPAPTTSPAPMASVGTSSSGSYAGFTSGGGAASSPITCDEAVMALMVDSSPVALVDCGAPPDLAGTLDGCGGLGYGAAAVQSRPFGGLIGFGTTDISIGVAGSNTAQNFSAGAPSRDALTSTPAEVTYARAADVVGRGLSHATEGTFAKMEASLGNNERYLGASVQSATGMEASVSPSGEKESDIQRLVDEMGFSRYQVVEAFKRCSTAEAAVDWIFSPEREWNQ